MSDAAAAKKDSGFSMFAFWRTDPDEVRKQLERYHTGGLFHTARGWSALACLLSVAITVLLGRAMGISTASIVVEVLIWSSFAAFMWRGHRWAFVAAMVLWTLEKATMLFTGMAGGRAPITQFIWWIGYMHVFMLGLRVEKARRQPPAEEPVPGAMAESTP